MFKAERNRQKISHYVVDQIRTAILGGQFKPGDRVASEKELMDQFQVSKATLREAIRVLELTGLIEIRKGLGGGIFAAEVDMNTTIHSLSNFLHFKNVSIRDITMFRFILEPLLTQIAASKAGEADIRRLKEMTDQEVAHPNDTDPKGIGFHRYIARFSENPFLILLLDFSENLLADVKRQLQPKADFYDEILRDHLNILEYFKNKDIAGAGRAMAEHVLCVGDHLARIANLAPFRPYDMNPDGCPHVETEQPGNASPSLGEDILHRAAAAISGDSRMLLRHVGTGELYLVELTDKKHADRQSGRKP